MNLKSGNKTLNFLKSAVNKMLSESAEPQMEAAFFKHLGKMPTEDLFKELTPFTKADSIGNADLLDIGTFNIISKGFLNHNLIDPFEISHITVSPVIALGIIDCGYYRTKIEDEKPWKVVSLSAMLPEGDRAVGKFNSYPIAVARIMQSDPSPLANRDFSGILRRSGLTSSPQETQTIDLLEMVACQFAMQGQEVYILDRTWSGSVSDKDIDDYIEEQQSEEIEYSRSIFSKAACKQYNPKSHIESVNICSAPLGTKDPLMFFLATRNVVRMAKRLLHDDRRPARNLRSAAEEFENGSYTFSQFYEYYSSGGHLKSPISSFASQRT